MRTGPASPHDCCRPAGQDDGSLHQPQKSCPGHDTAFESPGKVGMTNPASLAHMSFEMPVVPPVGLTAEPGYAPMTQGLAHPPPDRCLLNSVLLI